MTDHMSWAEVNDQAKKLFDQKRYAEAIEIFNKPNFADAIKIFNKPNFPHELIPNLAKCYYYNRQANISLELLDSIRWYQFHELCIDYALYLNAIGDNDKAFFVLKSLENKNDPKVRFNLGWHYLRKGKFKEGFDLIQAGSECRAWGNEYAYIEQGILDPKKRWNMENDDCHILYILEGGLGDQIIFLRWVNHLESIFGVSVTVACDQQLMRLLCNAGYDCIPHQAIKDYQYHYYIPAMSYPSMDYVLDPKANIQFPYIETKKDKYIAKLISNVSNTDDPNRRLNRIGIKWFGNPEFEHDQMRTVPKNDLVDICSQYGKLFSFQFEDEDPNLLNTKHIIRDWLDTYSVISAMDMVVTSCTSIAHLCGAMNHPCIVMVPLVPYFTWACDDMPWYESVKVIRQTKYNDWSDAFVELDKTLCNYERSY